MVQLVNRRTISSRCRLAGLTLLELVVVTGILAVVAGSVVMALRGTLGDAQERVASAEIVEIKKALLQFQRDTGYLPKQGPFGLIGNGNNGQIDPANSDHWRNMAGADLSAATPAERIRWFESPANFYQLYRNPLIAIDATGTEESIHPLSGYDRSAARGWNGPYLSQWANGLVLISSGIDPDGSDGGGADGGDPADPSAPAIDDVPGIADPFLFGPEDQGTQDEADDRLVWVSLDDGQRRDRWGRPYLFLHDDYDPSDPDQVRAFRDSVRLLGFGPNGVYEGGGFFGGATADDVELFILR